MDFLGIVGPDALINSFTINCKDPKTGHGQQNIELVNELQNLIFNELTCKYFFIIEKNFIYRRLTDAILSE